MTDENRNQDGSDVPSNVGDKSDVFNSNSEMNEFSAEALKMV